MYISENVAGLEEDFKVWRDKFWRLMTTGEVHIKSTGPKCSEAGKECSCSCKSNKSPDQVRIFFCVELAFTAKHTYTCTCVSHYIPVYAFFYIHFKSKR